MAPAEALELRALMCADGHHHDDYITDAAAFDTSSNVTIAHDCLDHEMVEGCECPVATVESQPLEAAVATASLNSLEPQAHEGAGDYVEITPTQVITHHEVIPRFAANPTATTVRSGSWSDPATWSTGRIPVSGERVSIPAGFTVTYSQISNANLDALEIGGTLSFAINQNTRIKVGDILVLPTGTLRIGTAAAPVMSQFSAEIIIANKALKTGTVGSPGIDPKQLGTGLIVLGTIDIHGTPKDRTFLRLAAEPHAGDTSILLEQSVTGWNVGDTVLLPDSRQVVWGKYWDFVGGTLESHEEELTISRIEGNRVYFSRPLNFDHPGGRNLDGEIEILPHVGVLDRNVTIRSELPTGTRGHTMYHMRANVGIEYARFKDLGRTEATRPLNNSVVTNGQVTSIGSNQIGRYAIHLHHVLGAENPTNTGYQFKLVGNTVDHSKKWGIAVHNTSHGLVKDNIVFDAQGSGIVTEDGSEIENLIERNFTVGITGTRVEGTGSDGSDTGRAGTGFWFRRTGNIVRDNVAADSIFAGYSFNSYNSWNPATFPAFRGADKTATGAGITLPVNPSGVFDNNEAYGMSQHGLWAAYLNGPNQVANHPTVPIRNMRLWNSGLISAVLAYHTNGLAFENMLLLNDTQASNRPDIGPLGMNLTHYENLNLSIRNSRIEGFRVGIEAPVGDASLPGDSNPTIIENTTLKNYINVVVEPTKDFPYETAGNNLELRNVRFGTVTDVPLHTGSMTGPPRNIIMKYSPENANLTQPSTVKVYDYNGVPGDNFQVFYRQQHAGFIMPQTSASLLLGYERGPIGSPEAGLTNAQNWNKYGIAMMGAISPNTDDTTRPEFDGYTSPIPAPTTPRVVFINPQFGAKLLTNPILFRYTVQGELPAGSKVFIEIDGDRPPGLVNDGRIYDLPDGAHVLTGYIGDALTGAMIPGTEVTSVQFITGNGNVPLAAINNFAGAPLPSSVNEMSIRFNQPVLGFQLSDLSLTRDGGPNLLTASQTLTTSDLTNWRIGNLANLTRLPGRYVLTLRENSVTTATGVSLPIAASEAFTVGNILGRHIFYNRSYFDGGNAAANSQDDAAIATDKSALLPGETATFSNYTSYLRGINGIMIDVRNLSGTPTAGDFSFKVGNTQSPQNWATVSVAPTITVRRGAGVDGSDRITLIWPDNAIQQQWLQVTVNPTAATGLAGPDVFYFGNAIGEAGNSATNAQVTVSDEIYARNNPHTFANPALITDNYDFNRDRVVTATDQIIARSNRTTISAALNLFAAPSSGIGPSALTAGPGDGFGESTGTIPAGRLQVSPTSTTTSATSSTVTTAKRSVLAASALATDSAIADVDGLGSVGLASIGRSSAEDSEAVFELIARGRPVR